MADPRSLPPEVVDALRRGDKIEAIKLLRAAGGLGLAEAKGLIDHHAGAVRPTTPKPGPARAHAEAHTARTARGDGLGPGEQPRTSGAAGVVMVIAIAGLAYWLYSRFG